METDTLQTSELSTDDFFEAICTRLEYQQVVAAIMELDKTYSNVLYYHLIFNYSFAEIAKMSGEKPATIRKRFSRGKALLLNSLKIMEGGFYNDKK